MRTRKYFVSISTCLITLLAFAASSPAASLAWDPNTEPVDGYRIYYGTSETAQSQTLNVGNVTSYNLDALPLSENIPYYISLTAYNAAGESAKAGPLTYTPADRTPPSPPVGIAVVPPN